MKNKGFTLVELLAILVVLGVIATIATPIVQKTLKDNKEKVYNVLCNQLIGNAKDYMASHSRELPQNEGNTVTVNLETLKKSGLTQINIINPKTNKVISDQSEVSITKHNNNYTYSVTTYDLVSIDELEPGAPIINGVSNTILNCTLGGTCDLESIDGVSRQIVFKDNEVSAFNEMGTYSVYYNKLENGKLGISIRTINVN